MPANESVIPRLHLFHQWTRWTAPETVQYRMPRIHPAGESIDDQYFTFTRDEQSRRCVVCGAEQVSVVGSGAS
jgi:hypothetical protein